MLESKTIGAVDWTCHKNGTVTLHFYNALANVDHWQDYKTRAAAKAAETRFYDRLNRIESERRMREIFG